jgi:hypothetical protein
MKHDDPDNPMLHFVLENLAQCRCYQLEVRAMNAIGWGEPHKEFTFHTRCGT